MLPLALPLTSLVPVFAPPLLQEPQLGVDVAAVGGQQTLTFAELGDLLIWRHGRSPDGRAALRQLLNLRVLEELAAKQGLEVGEAAVRKRMADLDREIRESGVEGGLAQYLRESEIEVATFQEYLRLALVQEELARRALDLGPDEPVSGEEQEAWLLSVLEERGYEEFAHPWADGVVAKSGSLEIRRDDLAEHLRTLVPREEVSDACYEILLERQARARMPDLAEEGLDRALDVELARRRAESESDPRYQGVTFEQLLDAQGLSLEALRRDPAVRVAALSRIWVDRTYDDDALKRAYEDDRELFDSTYGEAVELYGIHLRAARFKNEFNPRTFEEAEEELVRLSKQIGDVEDLKRLAALHSEDPRSRELGGRLGFVTRGAPTVPRPIRDVVFDAVDQARALGTSDDAVGTILGPVRIQGGAVLLGIGARRPAPAWETMADYVHRELRRRFLAEALPRESVVTWLDRK